MTATTTLTRERQDLLETLAKHRGFLRQTIQGMSAEQIRERSTVSALTLGAIVQHVTEMEVQWGAFIDVGADAMAGHDAREVRGDVDARRRRDRGVAARRLRRGLRPERRAGADRRPRRRPRAARRRRGSRPAPAGRPGACSCTSSPRPRSTPATPTSSARRSTARRRWAEPTRRSSGARIGRSRAASGRRTWPCRDRARGSSRRPVAASSVPNTSTNASASMSLPRASEPSSPSSIARLARPIAATAPAASSRGPRDRGVLDLVGRDHAVDEPDRERLVGLHLPAAPDQLLGPRRTDRGAGGAGCRRRRG